MKRLLLCLFCAFMALGVSAQRIDTHWAWFDDPDEVFESQPQYLPPQWRDYDMVVAERNDPFLSANTKSKDPLVNYLTNNRKRVTVYIFQGDVPSQTAAAVNGYVDGLFAMIGAAWNKDNKKGLGNNSFDKAFYGKLGEFAEYVEKREPAKVNFKGDPNAVKYSWVIAASKSKLLRNLGAPFDFYVDAYTYYCPRAKKSVAAIFYKIGINQQILNEPTFNHQALRLMMQFSQLFDPRAKDNVQQWDDLYKKIEQDEMSDMEGSFIKYFHLKVPKVGGGPEKPEGKPENKNDDDDDGELGGEQNWWIWWTTEDPIITYEPVIENPLRQTQFDCIAIDIDESPTTVYVLLLSEVVMMVDKVSGEIGYSGRFANARSIAWVGNDLGIYCQGKGLVGLQSKTTLWRPEDENSKFDVHSSAHHTEFILRSDKWIVTLDASGNELFAYELHSPVSYLLPDKKGRTWTADENRNLRYLQGEEIGDYMPLPRDAYGAVGLAEAKDGRVMVSTSRRGVLTPNIDNNEFKELIAYDVALGAMLFPVVNSQGTVYAVSEQEGLYHYRFGKDSQFQLLARNIGLTPHAIKAPIGRHLRFVFVDSMDNLWIAFSSHLVIYNPTGVVGYANLSGIQNLKQIK